MSPRPRGRRPRRRGPPPGRSGAVRRGPPPGRGQRPPSESGRARRGEPGRQGAPRRRRSASSSSRLAAAPPALPEDHKKFEIRKGRVSGPEKAVEESEEALEEVALPQSITQEAEASSLRKRFGRDLESPLFQRDERVRLHRSVGTEGPVVTGGKKTWLVITVVLLLATLGGFLFMTPQGRQLLGR